tara:strand:+ start:1463 stop:2416 length:954 start_codon:yes stop_codon:yes gene_type:complete
MEFIEARNGDIVLRVAIKGSGPVVLCVHGWPELWYSWRHQISHFSELGYTVAAMDVRGYGGSSKPESISAYSIKNLSSDVAAIIREISNGPVVLLGHDWGAPIVWNTALLYPDLVRAVAGLSVPYTPGSDTAFIDMAKQLYADRFFYQIYFQTEGIAEAELEADVPAALRKIYYAISGDAPSGTWLTDKPGDSQLLDGMVDPDPFPTWLTTADLEKYSNAFQTGGFRGPLNRYRAQGFDIEELVAIRGQTIQQPACFIGGEKDPVRHFVTGFDMYANPGTACDDFRGSTIIDGVGHWVQQEAPTETNAALKTFLSSL